MLIVELPLTELRGNLDNPRSIPVVAIDNIRQSLQHYGWQQPIVVGSGGRILAGHGRHLAAQKIHDMGKRIPRWQDTSIVPIVYAMLESKEDEDAYNLADNKTGEFSSWDLEKVGKITQGLTRHFTGFGKAELEAINNEYLTIGLTEIHPARVDDTLGDPIAFRLDKKKDKDFRDAIPAGKTMDEHIFDCVILEKAMRERQR